MLQAGLMESRCLLYPAGFTLAGVNALSLYAINHQPCKLYNSLLCMLSIKQQIMTSLRSPGTHLLAFPPSQNETYQPFQGLAALYLDACNLAAASSIALLHLTRNATIDKAHSPSLSGRVQTMRHFSLPSVHKLPLPFQCSCIANKQQESPSAKRHHPL